MGCFCEIKENKRNTRNKWSPCDLVRGRCVAGGDEHPWGVPDPMDAKRGLLAAPDGIDGRCAQERHHQTIYPQRNAGGGTDGTKR